MSRIETWYFDDNPSALYERFLVPAKFLPWAEDLVRIGNPQPGDKVLDVACGTGTVTRLPDRGGRKRDERAVRREHTSISHP